MGLIRLTTTPLILDIADLRDHLRVDGVQDDAALNAIQRSAVQYVEVQTNTQVGVGTFRLTLDTFPTSREIRIPRPPLASVQAVKFIDRTGQEQTFDPATYKVDTTEQPGRIVLRAGQSWPATADEPGAITIDFTAGHESGQEPETIRHLIRLLVGAWFELREGATDRRYDELPVPFAVTTLIQMHEFQDVV